MNNKYGGVGVSFIMSIVFEVLDNIVASIALGTFLLGDAVKKDFKK